jgi:hypothetical protein
MILNIRPGTFGGPARAGDIIAICNVVQHLRSNNPDVKFFMQDGTINDATHCRQFFSYLQDNTDYFARSQGTHDLAWNRVNVWDYRAISGDVVSIPNKEKTQLKVVMCPLFDAPYNIYRNWPKNVFYEKLEKYFNSFTDWEKVICITDERLLPPGDYSQYTICTDYIETLHHIKTCKRFIGGETGTAMFAWSLERGPDMLHYVMSNRGLLHTTPFHFLSGKGQLEQYWLDFEGTTWN